MAAAQQTPLEISSRVPMPHSKFSIPRIGLGVYKSVGPVCIRAVTAALEAGYRHIDSAQYYENEAEVGEAIRQSKVDRKEIFVTTKLWEPVYDSKGTPDVQLTLKSLRGSVERMKLGYVDLFLIHGPSGGTAGRRVMWDALKQLRREGLTRDIGVSNYGVRHLQEMLAYSSPPSDEDVPACNQIEQHPWLQSRSLVAFCSNHVPPIPIVAYSPIARGKFFEQDPRLVSLARKLKKSEAQVLLRWSLQKGFIPIPKSEHPERIRSNIDLYSFSLDAADMALLDSFDKGPENGAICPYRLDDP